MKKWQQIELSEALAKANLLRRVAIPTLRALAYGGPDSPPMLHYFGRSVERLWMDGGSIKGFYACLLLGWAEWSASDSSGFIGLFQSNRERLGRLTDAGREAFNSLAVAGS